MTDVRRLLAMTGDEVVLVHSLDCFVAGAPRNDGCPQAPRNDGCPQAPRNDGCPQAPRNDGMTG
jgi:hypothetical protein